MHRNILDPSCQVQPGTWLRIAFEECDRQRRACWSNLAAFVVDGAATPFRSVYSAPGFELRGYEVNRTTGPVLLAVPAPIKNADVWDLAPWASVVRRCMQANIRVYLIQWTPPTTEQAELGLLQYADRFIDDCVNAIALQTGQDRVLLAGHSLGGTLAAIYAALHSHRIAGLLLLAAPLHFGPTIGSFAAASSIASGFMALTIDGGNVPGSLLSACSFAADPVTFGWSRWLDWLCCSANSLAIRTNLLVERWALAESPIARQLFNEVVQLLYREDQLMQGQLRIDIRRACPRMIRAPLLCVLDRECRVVPPEAVLPFYGAIGSADKHLLWHSRETGLGFQHVGVLVGSDAHRQLWPCIVEWLQTSWRARLLASL